MLLRQFTTELNADPGRHQSTGWFNEIETENVKETTLQCGRNTLWVGSTAEIADDDDDSIGEAAEEVVEDCFGRRKVVTPSLPLSLLLALPEDRAGRGEQSAQAAVVTAPSERAPLLSSGAANCPAHILSRLAITGESRTPHLCSAHTKFQCRQLDALKGGGHLSSKLRTTASCPPRTLCMQSVRAHSKANRSNLPNAAKGGVWEWTEQVADGTDQHKQGRSSLLDSDAHFGGGGGNLSRLGLHYISRFGRFDVSGMEREGEERSFAVTAHITHAAAATWRTTGKSVSGDTFGQERSGEGE